MNKKQQIWYKTNDCEGAIGVCSGTDHFGNPAIIAVGTAEANVEIAIWDNHWQTTYGKDRFTLKFKTRTIFYQ